MVLPFEPFPLSFELLRLTGLVGALAGHVAATARVHGALGTLNARAVAPAATPGVPGPYEAGCRVLHTGGTNGTDTPLTCSVRYVDELGDKPGGLRLLCSDGQDMFSGETDSLHGWDEELD